MRCPVCRAENAGTGECRRCRADLALLVRVQGQRHSALKAAQNALLVQNARAVLTHARTAQQLRAGDDSLRLLALGNLLARDYAAACRCYRRAKKNSAATRSAD